MFRKKGSLKWGLIIVLIFAAILFIRPYSAQAVPLAAAPAPGTQYWQPLPPYNLLWPLWSPALSPVDPVTGLPTPLVSSITNNTILPLQPALYWDPARTYPFLLYNIPDIFGGGLTFFDEFYGLNPWPPAYLIDPITGLPAPISLPTGFAALSPFPPLNILVFTGNLLYSEQYGAPVTSLLTTGDIWGTTPLAGLIPVI
jgi:hypothetical protein